jgi:histidinol-phosphate/aromatic aminotransferase/cobyric acid decarboxylase-like protein
LLPTEYIYEFAAGNAEKTVVVDESFIDFAGCISVMERLEAAPLDNVIVIKSLSKSLGVPGIRLGFTYSHDVRFNRTLRDALPIWNTNSVAEGFLELILKHRNSLAASFEKSARDRAEFAETLAGFACVKRVYPSGGNFLLVEFHGKPDLRRLASHLLARHAVYVKDVTHKFDDGKGYLRLAVRLPEENVLLLRRLAEYFSEERGASPVVGSDRECRLRRAA